MAFLLKDGTPILRKVILAASVTIQVGEAVKSYSVAAGGATNATAGVAMLGIVHALCNFDGSPIASTNPSAGVAGSPAVTSVTTASDNLTVAKYCALVDVSTTTRYSAAVSGTIGTTVASGYLGPRIDVNSAGTNYGQVLETTATRTLATDANFYDWGTDPDDSTRLLVSIAFSETMITSP